MEGDVQATRDWTVKSVAYSYRICYKSMNVTPKLVTFIQK
jgi:hypothetical protein